MGPRARMMTTKVVASASASAPALNEAAELLGGAPKVSLWAAAGGGLAAPKKQVEYGPEVSASGAKGFGAMLKNIYPPPEEVPKAEAEAGPRKPSALDKLKKGVKNVALAQRMRTSAIEKEIAAKQLHGDRVDLFIYLLFMFLYTLNTIDGLGDASYNIFTEKVIETLGLRKFDEIVDMDGLNSFLQTDLIAGVFSSNFEAAGTLEGAGDPFDTTASASGGWVLQGPVRISQLRSDAYDCSAEMPPIMASKDYPYSCTYSRRLSYSNYYFKPETESTEDFRGFTYDNPLVEKVSVQRAERKYTEYETYFRHSFPAPAFAVLVDGHRSRSEAQATVDHLVEARYVDRQTNAVFVDLSVYNYLVDSTMWVRLTAEFNAAGGVDSAFEAVPAQLFWRPASYAYKLTMTLLVALGYGYFIYKIFEAVWDDGLRETLKRPLTYIQALNAFLYLANTFFQYESYCLCAGGFLSSYSLGNVNFLSRSFLDFRAPVRSFRLAITYQSMNTFLNWFKLVGYLAKYPVFALMTKTLQCAFDELSAFAVVFLIVMFGFAQAHTMFFGKQLQNYQTVVTSFLTLFRAMLGDFNFAETYELNYVMGPLFFMFFVGIAFLVVLNIIIAIIADAYVEANNERKVVLTKKKAAKAAALKDLHEKQRQARVAREEERHRLRELHRQQHKKTHPGVHLPTVSLGRPLGLSDLYKSHSSQVVPVEPPAPLNEFEAALRSQRIAVARAKYRAKVAEVFDSTELTKDTFKQLMRDPLFTSEMGAVPPSDRDLEVAFDLADSDRSNLVNEAEFLKLYELVMAGTVVGIASRGHDQIKRHVKLQLRTASAVKLQLKTATAPQDPDATSSASVGASGANQDRILVAPRAAAAAVEPSPIEVFFVPAPQQRQVSRDNSFEEM